MSSSVVSVPQFSTARILRPFNNYADWYNGKSGRTLLMFSENGVALDEMAGTPGYVPGLVRGCSVAMGSCLMLWLPFFLTKTGGTYNWVISWRLRNINDAARAQMPAHLPVSGPVFPVPAAAHTVIYNSADPGIPTLPAVQNAYPEYFISNPGGLAPEGPFVPNQLDTDMIGDGAVQNGIGAITSAYSADLPAFRIVEVAAQGDQFTLGIYKTDESDWDFDTDGDDVRLWYWLGTNSNVGAYAAYGVSS